MANDDTNNARAALREDALRYHEEGRPGKLEFRVTKPKATSRDLSRLGYYIGFNRWKSACIVHGVYARYMEGKKSTEGIDLEEMRERIGRTLGLAEQAVKRLTG